MKVDAKDRSTLVEILAWGCFDFANSAFSVVVVSVVYAVYFQSVIAGGDARAARWWSWALAVSQIAVVVTAPWVGGWADRHSLRKASLLAALATSAVATLGLIWVGPGHVALALSLVGLANYAMLTGDNLNGSFLPQLAVGRSTGALSGCSLAFGYAGAMGSLLVSAWWMQDGWTRVPWVLIPTGGGLAVGAGVIAGFLRERQGDPPEKDAGLNGWDDWRSVPAGARLFMAAYAAAMAGLAAMVAYSAVFAVRELGFGAEETLWLFASLLAASGVGAGISIWAGKAAQARHALLSAVAGWAAVCVMAARCTTHREFFLLATLAGIALGMVQASARTVMAGLAPKFRPARAFGLYGFAGKCGGVVGYLTMGAVASAWGFRRALLATAAFFLLSGCLLLCFRMTSDARTEKEPGAPEKR